MVVVLEEVDLVGERPIDDRLRETSPRVVACLGEPNPIAMVSKQRVHPFVPLERIVAEQVIAAGEPEIRGELRDRGRLLVHEIARDRERVLGHAPSIPRMRRYPVEGRPHGTGSRRYDPGPRRGLRNRREWMSMRLGNECAGEATRGGPA